MMYSVSQTNKSVTLTWFITGNAYMVVLQADHLGPLITRLRTV